MPPRRRRNPQRARRVRVIVASLILLVLFGALIAALAIPKSNGIAPLRAPVVVRRAT